MTHNHAPAHWTRVAGPVHVKQEEQLMLFVCFLLKMQTVDIHNLC